MKLIYQVSFAVIVLSMTACVKPVTKVPTYPWERSEKEYDLAYSVLVSRETFDVYTYKSIDELHRSVVLSLGPKMTEMDTSQYGSYENLTFNMDLWLTKQSRSKRLKIIERWMLNNGDTLWLYKYRHTHQIDIGDTNFEKTNYLRSYIELM